MKRLVLLLLPFVAAACRIDEEVVVHPDGSGKVTLSMGVPRKNPGDAGRWPDLGFFEKQWSGVVAWSEPKLHEDDTYRYAVVTGYFEDINRLRLWRRKYEPDVPLAEREPLFTYRRDEAGGEHRITVTCGQQEVFKVPEAGQTWEGRRFSRKITVPGEVTGATGITVRKGRTAGVVVDDALIRGVINGRDEAIAGLEAANRPMVIRWKKSAVTDEEVKAFHREMAAARERWKTLRVEWKERGGR